LVAHQLPEIAVAGKHRRAGPPPVCSQALQIVTGWQSAAVMQLPALDNRVESDGATGLAMLSPASVLIAKFVSLCGELGTNFAI
jgi:hypothetical protein